LFQTVSVFRFNTLSINYRVPAALAHRFGSRTMGVALQGSNLGLHTNYRGKDSDVNAFSTGNATADSRQLPQPRSWSIAFTLGN